MNIPEDFKEFIALLNVHKVRYLIVGGYAVGFHSRPKFTQDIDIWVENSKQNGLRLKKVLEEFGFGSLDITIEDLTSPDKVIQLGNAPLRIDLITSISGIGFRSAYENRVTGKYFNIDADFISLDDLIINKKSSNREKDLEDLRWIEKYSR